MKNCQKPKRLSALRGNQHGAIGIMIALILPILCGFAGLAVDIGHSYAVKSQLKNAADAGALRGARALVPYTGTPGTPNWASALVQAPLTVQLNKADNKPLTGCEVTYGYWSFTTTPPSLKSAGIVPTANDFPAVSVQVSKTEGKNDGPVTMYLASILGVLSADVSATCRRGA
jgi:Flp pilus assembly protein TadG